MSDDQPPCRPKADLPVTLQQQALELKNRMQVLQNQVCALLDEFRAAELCVNLQLIGPPVEAKHRVVIEVFKKF